MELKPPTIPTVSAVFVSVLALVVLVAQSGREQEVELTPV